MPANFFSKIKRIVFRIFHRKQHVKQSKHYSETELTGVGYTITPTYIRDRFFKSDKDKMGDKWCHPFLFYGYVGIPNDLWPAGTNPVINHMT